MVYTLKLDEAWAKKTRELTRLDMSVTLLSPERAAAENAHVTALSSGQDALLELRDEQTLATYTLLRDIDGAPVALVEILHPRPHFAAARDMQRALSIGIAVGAGLLGMLAYLVVHFGLLRRVRELVELVAAIKNGVASPSSSPSDTKPSRDELARLGQQVRGMSHALAEREGNLRAAEALAHAVLGAVDEAFGAVQRLGRDRVGGVGSRTRLVRRGQGKVWSYLGDEREGWLLEFGIEQLTAGFLPVDLALAQLPSSFHRGGDTFLVRYQPLLSGEQVTGLLLVIEHATERVALAKSEAIATELCQCCDTRSTSSGISRVRARSRGIAAGSRGRRRRRREVACDSYAKATPPSSACGAWRRPRTHRGTARR